MACDLKLYYPSKEETQSRNPEEAEMSAPSIKFSVPR